MNGFLWALQKLLCVVGWGLNVAFVGFFAIIYSAGAANIFFTNTPDFRMPIIEDVVNRPAIIAPVTPQVSTS
jgi:hypothetical protein